MLVMVDGRSIYMTVFSGVLWDDQMLPLEEVDRIEVMRGPGATMWGANAVNGVINIITKPARATEGGFAAIGFVSALTGHRFHNRSMKEWFISELQEALGTSVHDVPMILNYLSTRGDLDMDNIGMFGQGSGGAIAILAASA
jgi:iron complex outermembrane receptor protein